MFPATKGNALYNVHNIKHVLSNVTKWDDKGYSYLNGQISPKKFCMNGFELYKADKNIMSDFVKMFTVDWTANYDIIKQFLVLWTTDNYSIAQSAQYVY